MLKITLLTEGEKLSLRLEGHAEYAEHGKDIVCASASILAHIVARDVDLLDRFNAYKEPAVIKLESGYTEITCVPTDVSEHIRDTYCFAGTGFCLLAENYPQYVEFITDVEDD
jgi:uncharacterized protein YsxB (DUF464 family)